MNFGPYSATGIKTFRGMEGEGFNATLRHDGVRVADCIDSGDGGGVIMRFSAREHKEALLQFVETLQREPFKGVPESLKVDESLFIGCLVAHEIERKALHRMCKQKTLYRIPGDEDGNWRVVDRPFSPTLRATILARSGKEAIFANELPGVCAPKLAVVARASKGPGFQAAKQKEHGRYQRQCVRRCSMRDMRHDI